MDPHGDLYTDDELDNEWARYVASLNQKEELDKKTQERKSIEARERETMINLQRHVRGLSRARFELEDAAIDSFDDSSSETETGTVNILPTPIPPNANSDDNQDYNNNLSSDSDDDDDIIAPTPTESEQMNLNQICMTLKDNPSKHSSRRSSKSMSRKSSFIINSCSTSSTPTKSHSSNHYKSAYPILKPISTDTEDITSRSPSESNNGDPYNTKLDEIQSMQDLQDSDSADHKLISINYSNDSHHDSGSSSSSSSSSSEQEEEEEEEEDNNQNSDDTNDGMISMSPKRRRRRPRRQQQPQQQQQQQQHNDNQYDEELEQLKQELNQFKRRNFQHLRRTKSQEQVLLSVLNINHKDIDAQQLEQCTQKVIDEYNRMTQNTKNKYEKKKSQNELLETISNLDPKDKLFEFPASPIIMTPIPESPMPTINDIYDKKMKQKKTKRRSKSTLNKPSSKRRLKPKKNKQRNRRLADPYSEEWNGLDPDNYFWNDDVPEGECYDDKELSLRNRRIQYLVVMAIENNYCTISDLTYKQNELLLLYQQSLIF